MIKKILPFIFILFTVSIYPSDEITQKKTGGVDLVFIPGGSFVMGSESKGRDYHPPRTVTVTKGFWMGRYEITQKQYMDVTGINPCEKSKYGEGDSLPVFNISWYEAVEFCNRLSELNGLKPYYIITKDSKEDDNISPHNEEKWRVRADQQSNGFRLPTEAEWEYGCRAGSKTDFYWGKDSSWDGSGSYSWHMFNTGVKRYSKGRFWWVKFHKVKKVGTRIPNKFGLHDMSGNVAEWCYDRYSSTYYSESEKKDPAGNKGEYLYRVARGGSMLDSPKDLTSYKRWPVEPFERIGMNGLRVVLPE